MVRVRARVAVAAAMDEAVRAAARAAARAVAARAAAAVRGGQLQEARVGHGTGCVSGEWPVLLGTGLERRATSCLESGNPFCRLRGLPQDGLDVDV